MKLVLDLIGPPRLMGARNRCELHSGSLTLGRSPESDWVIPDMDRAISRRHLRIDAGQDGFVLTDTSSNGVYLNGNDVPVGYGASVTLKNGDTLRVGEARIAVAIESVSEVDLSQPDTAALGDRFGSSRMPANPLRDPLGGPFGGKPTSDRGSVPNPAGPLTEAPRQIIDANWMIRSGAEPGLNNSHSNGDAQRIQQNGRAAPHGEGSNGSAAPQTLLALVEKRPDLSARRLAEAVDAATQNIEASVRQALHHKINLMMD